MRRFFFVLLLGLVTASIPAYAVFENNSQAFGNSDSEFVTVDQAFPLIVDQNDHQLFISWDVQPGYYLYQDKISISADKAQLGDIQLRDGTPYHDEFFGDVNIYTEPLYLEVTLLSASDGAQLFIQYQGCAKAGFCYPPETRTFPLTPVTPVALPDSTSPTDKAQEANSNQARIVTEQASLAEQLQKSAWTPLLFLLLGVGLAFTPCVFPMYPILTSIVLGAGKLSHSRALGLSFVYVQGMALTYTLLGLIVASAGLQFQAALQHPYVLIGLSLLFILLALSMFGLYTIQLPAALQTRLNNLSNRQHGGHLSGVFLMGAISGLVCSPCTTAPLSGALLYVAQSGDLLTGGIALYALGLGMGIPLILVAVFGNQLLPKAGDWMERVKILFGFILLAAPVYLLERLLSENWSVTLWSLLGISAFGWLYHAKNSLEFGGWKQSLLGIIAVLGLLGSAMPLYQTWFSSPVATAENSIQFQRVHNVAELEQQLQLAKKAGKPVMLDFYADWCVACIEFEKYTFPAPEVRSSLSGYVLLQADVTDNTPEDIELFKRLNIIGLPTIDFWGRNGEYHPDARVTGYMDAAEFSTHLQRLDAQ
ncbi:protein-disulfide reductase DsbD [Vibrio albus]|uniref:Thiol:disulfide interchange protein DsbD n=1 Tax=Vibrio albus TaxID=2200953 RepID=A0A2U3BAC9_9VIBR|nr:protein-disulfide reductase DsbD [Vibrio albus]PWI33737.1 protein-disulfide reductase DsbD [Vibrio albus]